RVLRTTTDDAHGVHFQPQALHASHPRSQSEASPFDRRAEQVPRIQQSWTDAKQRSRRIREIRDSFTLNVGQQRQPVTTRRNRAGLGGNFLVAQSESVSHFFRHVGHV